MFYRSTLKVGLQVAQVAEHNIDKLALFLGGRVEGDIIFFTGISERQYDHHAFVGDWILFLDTDDILVLEDRMFNRLFNLGDFIETESLLELPEGTPTRDDMGGDWTVPENV